MKEIPNLNYVDQLAGKNMEFREKFIKIMKDEFPIEMALYHQHMCQNKPMAASQDVHKIKHKMNIIGLDDSYVLATRYEEELRDGKIHLHKEFDAILIRMDNYIKNI